MRCLSSRKGKQGGCPWFRHCLPRHSPHSSRVHFSQQTWLQSLLKEPPSSFHLSFYCIKCNEVSGTADQVLAVQAWTSEAVPELGQLVRGIHRSQGWSGVLARGSTHRGGILSVLSILYHSLSFCHLSSLSQLAQHQSNITGGLTMCLISERNKTGSLLLLSPCLVSLRIQPLPTTACFALWAHCSETLSVLATHLPFLALKEQRSRRAVSHPPSSVRVAGGEVVCSSRPSVGFLPNPWPWESLSCSIPADAVLLFA